MLSPPEQQEETHALSLYACCVYTVNATFVELPAFERFRSEYLDDEGLRALQLQLLESPLAGDVISGTGGLRKLRRPDPRRGKGKRGGLRVIYYWWERGAEFWLITLYDKDEASDLSPRERRQLKELVERRRDEAEGK